MMDAKNASNVHMTGLCVKGAPGRLVKLLGLVSTEYASTAHTNPIMRNEAWSQKKSHTSDACSRHRDSDSAGANKAQHVARAYLQP